MLYFYDMRIFFSLIAIFVSLMSSQAQEARFLRVEIDYNLFTQKIDFFDGQKKLTQAETRTILQTNPESLNLYEKFLNKNKINRILFYADLGLIPVTAILGLNSHQQSGQVSGLFWPFLVSSLALTITIESFGRQARNLGRHAVDHYNFGSSPISPSRIFESNPIQVPSIFFISIPLK